MKRYLPHIFFALAVAMCCFSCTRDLDINLPEPRPKIVVNATLNSGEDFVAFISRSVGAGSSKPVQWIDSAVVLLFENDIFLDTLQHVFIFESGTYLSNNAVAKSGKTYRLDVFVNGLDPVSATTTIPADLDFQITNFETGKNDPVSNRKFSDFTLSFNEPGISKDFYSLTVFAYDSVVYVDELGNEVSTRIFEERCVSPQDFLVQESVSFSFGGQNCYSDLVFSDRLINGRNANLRMRVFENDEGYIVKQKALLVLFGRVSESYFEHQASVAAYQVSQGNPFAEPVQIYSNISGGLGVLRSSNIQTKFVYE